MDLSDFLRKQKELDDFIIKTQLGIEKVMPAHHKAFLSRRFLAAFVELGELVNEVEDVWKYWKQHPRVDKGKQLKEYVDLLHFFLSIGNTLQFEAHEIENAYNEKYTENIIRQQNGY